MEIRIPAVLPRTEDVAVSGHAASIDLPSEQRANGDISALSGTRPEKRQAQLRPQPLARPPEAYIRGYDRLDWSSPALAVDTHGNKSTSDRTRMKQRDACRRLRTQYHLAIALEPTPLRSLSGPELNEGHGCMVLARRDKRVCKTCVGLRGCMMYATRQQP